MLGRRLAAVVALLAFCGACDVPSPRKAAVESPSSRETPFKHGFGSADPNLARIASSYHLPEFPADGRLPAAGDIAQCIIRRSRVFDFEGKPHTLVAVWVSQGADCGGRNAVLLALHGPGDGRDTRLVVEVIGESEEFALPAPVAGMRLQSGTKLASDAEGVREIDNFLNGLIAIEPIPGGALPEWPADELQPPLWSELTFEVRADRATYEVIPKRNEVVLCWKTADTRLLCTAEAPGRRPAQIEIFAAHGFNEFRSTSHRAALERFLADAVPPGPTPVH